MNNIKVPSKYEAYLMSEQFSKIREAVFSRDGFRCVVCGSEEVLQAHHLTYRNVYDEDIGDLITLCRRCHATYHAVDNRREAIEEHYRKIDLEKIEQANNSYAEKQEEAERERLEFSIITKEIKEEYRDRDYGANGDLDMLSWPVLNAVIKKKCEEHKVDANYFQGKNQLHAYFLYRRCEFLLRCLNKGFTFSQVEKRTKFSSSWLMKWYRKDKCIAKLNEEKELFKEDN
jgi:hypothetical protein